jgi:hypothetical protein
MNAISPIETGIPLPKARARRGHYKDTIEQMQPGQSILIKGSSHNIRKAAYDAAERYGWRFTARTVQVDGQKACRIWRLE